jgi:hypothetical protein
MAPRPVFPLPAVAFEVAVIGAATTTAQQKKLSASAHSPWPALIRRLDQSFGI